MDVTLSRPFNILRRKSKNSTATTHYRRFVPSLLTAYQRAGQSAGLPQFLRQRARIRSAELGCPGFSLLRAFPRPGLTRPRGGGQSCGDTGGRARPAYPAGPSPEKGSALAPEWSSGSGLHLGRAGTRRRPGSAPSAPRKKRTWAAAHAGGDWAEAWALRARAASRTALRATPPDRSLLARSPCSLFTPRPLASTLPFPPHFLPRRVPLPLRTASLSAGTAHFRLPLPLPGPAQRGKDTAPLVQYPLARSQILS